MRSARHRAQRRRRPVLMAFVLIAAVLAALLWWQPWKDRDLTSSPAQGLVAAPNTSPTYSVPRQSVTDAPDRLQDNFPTVRQESATALKSPAPLARRSDAWVAQRFQDDGTTPVRWDPCRPIHYVTRLEGAPRGGQDLVTQAIADVSAATGLVFVDDGTTQESWSFDRLDFQPERYGDRWAPVLITWSGPGEVDQLQGPVIASAGAVAARRDQTPVIYVSGSMQLDADQITDMLDQDGAEVVRGVLRHELGHLVGLGHIDDRSQLMYDRYGPDLTTYQDGDLTGLEQMGTGPCVPQL